MVAQRQEQLGRRSKLYKSNKESASLKTTVPSMYVDLCTMTENDELEWSHEKINGECTLRVKLIKGPEESQNREVSKKKDGKKVKEVN